MSDLNWSTVSFTELLTKYKVVQSSLMVKVKTLASQLCQTNPAQFILIQFQMSQVTQVGESISNLIAQINALISNSVRNQKGG